MNSNIYIDSEQLSFIIENLKQEKENLVRVFENISKDGNGMINYWAGTSGEEISTELNNDIKVFEKITNDMNQYIAFLENVIQAYYKMDNMINKKLEENAMTKAY